MARMTVLEAFEDFVVGTTPVYTSSAFNEALGSCDRLSLQAVADQVTMSSGSPKLTVQIEQSTDERNWANKNSVAEIDARNLVTTATNNFDGVDTGAVPSQGFVRLRIALTAGVDMQAHVRVRACGRDTGG